jgi:hypothetical protein
LIGMKFEELLDADPKLLSVTGLVAGGNVSGSWWKHPQPNEMYRLV